MCVYLCVHVCTRGIENDMKEKWKVEGLMRKGQPEQNGLRRTDRQLRIVRKQTVG